MIKFIIITKDLQACGRIEAVRLGLSFCTYIVCWAAETELWNQCLVEKTVFYLHLTTTVHYLVMKVVIS